jgi:hypothetical protein
VVAEQFLSVLLFAFSVPWATTWHSSPCDSNCWWRLVESFRVIAIDVQRVGTKLLDPQGKCNAKSPRRAVESSLLTIMRARRYGFSFPILVEAGCAGAVGVSVRLGNLLRMLCIMCGRSGDKRAETMCTSRPGGIISLLPYNRLSLECCG